MTVCAMHFDTRCPPSRRGALRLAGTLLGNRMHASRVPQERLIYFHFFFVSFVHFVV